MSWSKTLPILLSWLMLPFSSYAQQASVGLPPAKVYREKGIEDGVAKFFENRRSQEKLAHLTRIQSRDSLEEQICTVSLSGTTNSIFPNVINTALLTDVAVYKTLRPDSPSPELNRLATFELMHPKLKHQYPRYSVAVWRTREQPTGETVYWIGVQLYWDAALEFFDYHFTDDIYYRNAWKASIAPPCRTQQTIVSRHD